MNDMDNIRRWLQEPSTIRVAEEKVRGRWGHIRLDPSEGLVCQAALAYADSLGGDREARIERAWLCYNFRSAYLESSPILADRMAFCARGHSDENGNHGDEEGCGWVLLDAADGGSNE